MNLKRNIYARTDFYQISQKGLILKIRTWYKMCTCCTMYMSHFSKQHIFSQTQDDFIYLGT